MIQQFRAGEENNNGAIARYDFIPAVNQPTFVLQGGGQLIGEQPTGQIFGLTSVGSYGPIAGVVESSFVPAGYVIVLATAGPRSPSNVIGVREHINASYRGLRQIPGVQPGYPLIESFYSRGFGTGTRYRGGAVVTQLKVSGSFDLPEILF